MIFSLVALFSGWSVARAVDQIKSVDFFVGDSDTTVSSQVNRTFSIYIGDNISGVTNPIKSVYVSVSGVYTGSGTLQLQLDSDSATSRTYTLPNVGSTPTPFTILYKDPSGKISPTTSGSYSYTLNVIPSGVTIYGLGAKAKTTYRYKPPACGGMPIYGDLTSAVFETTGSADGPAYNSIMWKGTPGTGKIIFQFATSQCTNGATNYPTCSVGTWASILRGGATCGTGDFYDTGVSPTGGTDKPVKISCANDYHNNQRYFKYKIRICSNADCATSGTVSPIVTDVIVNWAP